MGLCFIIFRWPINHRHLAPLRPGYCPPLYCNLPSLGSLSYGNHRHPCPLLPVHLSVRPVVSHLCCHHHLIKYNYRWGYFYSFKKPLPPLYSFVAPWLALPFPWQLPPPCSFVTIHLSAHDFSLLRYHSCDYIRTPANCCCHRIPCLTCFPHLNNSPRMFPVWIIYENLSKAWYAFLKL